MKREVILVTIAAESEWNATDAGIFRGAGYVSFGGAEYDGDTATLEYDFEYHEDEDLETVFARLEDDDSVIAYE